MPELPEEDKLEQGSQGQVGTTPVDPVTEGIPHGGDIICKSEHSMLVAACSPKLQEPQL